MNITDTHSHLYEEAFDNDRQEVLRRAEEAGVKRIFLPAIDSDSYKELFALAAEHPDICFPMIGLHPTSVNNNPNYKTELELVEKYLSNPPVNKFYAIGEVGLDLYWSKDWLKEQIEVFEHQIILSLRYKLPLVIHTRDAWPEMLQTLSKFRSKGLRGIMHSFSGSLEDYWAVKECGDFVFGISGVVTYKKAGMSELLEHIPIQDIVLETDAPYLAPVPYRGKRNESGYLTYICEKVADIYGMPPVEVAENTTLNASRIFGFSD